MPAQDRRSERAGLRQEQPFRLQGSPVNACRDSGSSTASAAGGRRAAFYAQIDRTRAAAAWLNASTVATNINVSLS